VVSKTVELLGWRVVDQEVASALSVPNMRTGAEFVIGLANR
jgi:hypothetical protein